MRGWLRRAVFAAAVLGMGGMAHADTEIETTGSAVIRNGDEALARKLAFRDAVVQAVQQGPGHLTSHVRSSDGQVTQTSTLRSLSEVVGTSIVEEEIAGDMLKLTVRVVLGKQEGRGCGTGTLRKLLIGGFVFEFPEELKPGEYNGYGEAASLEIRRHIEQRRFALVEHAPRAFIYRSAAKAPALLTVGEKEKEFAVVRAAGKYRSQYVVSGVFRQFTLGNTWIPGYRRRGIALDVYLHDGLNGALLAQRRFTGQAGGVLGIGLAPAQNSVTSGEAFNQTNLGAELGRIYEEVAAWADTQVSCLPFSARVAKIAGKSIYLDAGAEYKLAEGDELLVYRVLRNGEVIALNNEYLGREHTPASSLVIKSVYPLFAIGEIGATKALPIKVGDEIYAF